LVSQSRYPLSQPHSCNLRLIRKNQHLWCGLSVSFFLFSLASALVRHSIDAMKSEDVDEVRGFFLRSRHLLMICRSFWRPSLTTLQRCHCMNRLDSSGKSGFTVFTSTAKTHFDLFFRFRSRRLMTQRALRLPAANRPSDDLGAQFIVQSRCLAIPTTKMKCLVVDACLGLARYNV